MLICPFQVLGNIFFHSILKFKHFAAVRARGSMINTLYELIYILICSILHAKKTLSIGIC